MECHQLLGIQRLVRRLNKELDADVFVEMRYTPPFASDIIPKLINYDEIYAILCIHTIQVQLQNHLLKSL